MHIHHVALNPTTQPEEIITALLEKVMADRDHERAEAAEAPAVAPLPVPFKDETGATVNEDGDLVVSDLEYARLAAWHAADWAREPGRASAAIAQIREARAALDRAKRLLARYVPPGA